MSMLNFSKYGDFGMKFSQKIYEWQILRKITHQNRNQHIINVPLYQISINMENIRFYLSLPEII